MARRNEAVIAYLGQTVKVACDRNCARAWGYGNRPRVQSDDREVYLADDELPDAPIDPGSYEGGVAKPDSPNEFPQKWCIRSCERCAMSSAGAERLPLTLPDFSQRRETAVSEASR